MKLHVPAAGCAGVGDDENQPIFEEMWCGRREGRKSEVRGGGEKMMRNEAPRLELEN